jgi:hypothetical protein
MIMINIGHAAGGQQKGLVAESAGRSVCVELNTICSYEWPCWVNRANVAIMAPSVDGTGTGAASGTAAMPVPLPSGTE